MYNWSQNGYTSNKHVNGLYYALYEQVLYSGGGWGVEGGTSFCDQKNWSIKPKIIFISDKTITSLRNTLFLN